MKKRLVRAADLFCGAGGTSTGLQMACDGMGYGLDLFAVNHWDVAIATHTANHPDAQHACASVDTVDPRIAVPGGRLDLLWASPECTFFSVARGGKPVTDQGRASAWLILRWAELLYIDTILIENVKEFRDWCPVGVNGRPMKSKKGETFRAFIQSLKSLGYRVEWKVLNAADYGAATTRERLFIQARRGKKAVNWPNPSHSKLGGKTLFGKTKKWRAAREVIEWQTPSRSIFGRKRALAPATMARIIAGLEKFGGKELEPFLVILRNHADASSIEKPLPTLTAGGNHVGVAQPFLAAFHGGSDSEKRNYSVDEPIGTLHTGNMYGLVEPKPFILGHRQFDEACVDSIERPLRTITAKGGSDMGIVEPKAFIVPQFSDANPKSVDEPVGAITTTSRGMGLAQPFVTKVTHTKAKTAPVRSTESPLSTITTAKGGEHALVQPFIMPVNHGKNDTRTHSVEHPLPTITSVDATGIVEPLIAKYYGTGQCRPVSEPLDTVTAKDRFGLVTPLVRHLEDGTQVALDIHFRMLKPSELARAMSFPDTYQFTGNREAIVKQIGNAVDGSMARALCEAVLA
jgi:DNA (cytosine-5)-methyltransferase 1